MSKLSEKMNDDMLLFGLTKTTRDIYLRCVKRLAKYYNRTPDKITEQEVQQYILYLIKDRKLSYSSSNCMVCALKFFYSKTLGYSNTSFHLPPIVKTPQNLPYVPSRQEIKNLLSAANDIKHQVILMLAYGAGLRISEIANLKIKHIDSEHMCLHIKEGKGQKDRYALLSPCLLSKLREYWLTYHPTLWLFPHEDGVHPVKTDAIRYILYTVKKKLGYRRNMDYMR